LNPETGTAEQTLYFEGVENKTPKTGKSGSCNLNAGYYRVLFTLAKPGTQRIEWRETLHIYQNLESVFTFIFKEEYFNNTLYKVTFKYNYGVTDDGEQTRSHGEKVTKPGDPIRTGYAFGGWYKDAELTISWDFDTYLTDNVTLYAKWNLITYTVSFNSNGGIPTPENQIVSHGGKVTIPPDPSKTGNVFGGWFKDNDTFNIPWDFDADTVTDNNVILHAKWLPAHTVNFEPNGGTPVPAQQIVPNGGKITEPLTMTKPGNAFGGWFKDAPLTVLWDFHDERRGNLRQHHLRLRRRGVCIHILHGWGWGD
jgi:uncharacterized repeat protein (TIGR02543 family)